MTESVDEVYLVTGAAGGLGLALCEQIVGRGAALVAADVDRQRLDSLAGRLDTGSDRLLVRRLDVADAAAFRALVDEAVARFGRLSVLINNAAIMSSGAFVDVGADLWRKFLDVNVMGVVHGCRAAAGPMRCQGYGHIVNIASTAGYTPVLNSTPYVATKHAVVGLTHTLREELRADGVDVHLVIPGLLDTDVFDRAHDVGGLSSRIMADAAPVPKLAPAKAARYILQGIDENAPEITFPLINRVTVRAYQLFPRFMTQAIVRNQKH